MKNSLIYCGLVLILISISSPLAAMKRTYDDSTNSQSYLDSVIVGNQYANIAENSKLPWKELPWPKNHLVSGPALHGEHPFSLNAGLLILLYPDIKIVEDAIANSKGYLLDSEKNEYRNFADLQRRTFEKFRDRENIDMSHELFVFFAHGIKLDLLINNSMKDTGAFHVADGFNYTRGSKNSFIRNFNLGAINIIPYYHLWILAGKDKDKLEQLESAIKNAFRILRPINSPYFAQDLYNNDNNFLSWIQEIINFVVKETKIIENNFHPVANNTKKTPSDAIFTIRVQQAIRMQNLKFLEEDLGEITTASPDRIAQIIELLVPSKPKCSKVIAKHYLFPFWDLAYNKKDGTPKIYPLVFHSIPFFLTYVARVSELHNFGHTESKEIKKIENYNKELGISFNKPNITIEHIKALKNNTEGKFKDIVIQLENGFAEKNNNAIHVSTTYYETCDKKCKVHDFYNNNANDSKVDISNLHWKSLTPAQKNLVILNWQKVYDKINSREFYIKFIGLCKYQTKVSFDLSASEIFLYFLLH